MISSCWVGGGGTDCSALGSTAPGWGGGEGDPPKTIWGRPEAGVRGWLESPRLGVKGRLRIAFLPRGSSPWGFWDGSGDEGAGTHGQGSGGLGGAGGFGGAASGAAGLAVARYGRWQCRPDL